MGLRLQGYDDNGSLVGGGGEGVCLGGGYTYGGA